MYEENSLTHWGIKGMKWGVRRYQNKDGSLTPAGQKRYDDAPETPEEYEARKQHALKSGSVSDILKFRGDLTEAQLRAAKTRLELERDLKNIERSQIKTGQDRVESIISKIKTGTSAVTTVTDAWNAVAKINNTFRSSKMKVIGGNEPNAKISAKDILSSLRKSKTQDEALKKMAGYSDDEIAAIQKRMGFESKIKETLFNTGKSSKPNSNQDSRVDDILDRLDDLENKK